ncbi:hypothetical protein BDN72DRAFT_320916 [Pluteus cervinus]|uniref:Uncharacterized protein n=1 Tax=Pluteus cervinus TaxID=181527 RepID=A0ACD3ADS8_9AGAR|nr:hypothetical protein BDN72DRAFT_320916 [Pluteus cervinus]
MLSPRTLVYFRHGIAIRLRGKHTQQGPKHTPDTYTPDVDTSPPSSSTTHQVESSSTLSAKVQRPNEHIPNNQNDVNAGIGTEEYQHVSGDNGRPYDLDAPMNYRYGGRDKWVEDKGAETSHPGEGPEGSAKEGRKPER